MFILLAATTWTRIITADTKRSWSASNVVGTTGSADFYMYVSHARSTSDNSAGDARYAEAQEVRSDAKYNLLDMIFSATDDGGFSSASTCIRENRSWLHRRRG